MNRSTFLSSVVAVLLVGILGVDESPYARDAGDITGSPSESGSGPTIGPPPNQPKPSQPPGVGQLSGTVVILSTSTHAGVRVTDRTGRVLLLDVVAARLVLVLPVPADGALVEILGTDVALALSPGSRVRIALP